MNKIKKMIIKQDIVEEIMYSVLSEEPIKESLLEKEGFTLRLVNRNLESFILTDIDCLPPLFLGLIDIVYEHKTNKTFIPVQFQRADNKNLLSVSVLKNNATILQSDFNFHEIFAELVELFWVLFEPNDNKEIVLDKTIRNWRETMHLYELNEIVDIRKHKDILFKGTLNNLRDTI